MDKSHEKPLVKVETKEDLLAGLEIAQKEKDAFMEKESTFYDKELLEQYSDILRQFENKETGILYMKSLNLDVKKMEENFKKYLNFEEKRMQLSQRVWDFNNKLRPILYKENEENKIIENLKQEEEFFKSKNELADQLYIDLDKIHAQIPEEAKLAGMNTKIAMQTYLPSDEVRKANLIEIYIKELEKIEFPRHLQELKDRIESDKNYYK